MNQHLHWLKGELHAKATHDGTFDHILQSSPTKQNKKKMDVRKTRKMAGLKYYFWYVHVFMYFFQETTGLCVVEGR